MLEYYILEYKFRISISLFFLVTKNLVITENLKLSKIIDLVKSFSMNLIDFERYNVYGLAGFISRLDLRINYTIPCSMIIYIWAYILLMVSIF